MNDLFTWLYELLGYLEGFSDNLYDIGTNVPVGISMLLISLTGMVVYYYLIDHPQFGHWWNWLLVLIILCLINFVIAWALSDGALYNYYTELNQDVPYGATEFLTYSFVNSFWTLIFSFIFSMCIKWGSRNCTRSPF